MTVLTTCGLAELARLPCTRAVHHRVLHGRTGVPGVVYRGGVPGQGRVPVHQAGYTREAWIPPSGPLREARIPPSGPLREAQNPALFHPGKPRIPLYSTQGSPDSSSGPPWEARIPPRDHLGKPRNPLKDTSGDKAAKRGKTVRIVRIARIARMTACHFLPSSPE